MSILSFASFILPTIRDFGNRARSPNPSLEPSARSSQGLSEAEPTHSHPARHATGLHQLPTPETTSLVDDVLPPPMEDLSPSLRSDTLASEASAASAGTASVAGQLLPPNRTQSEGNQQRYETPKLERLFPRTVLVKCHIRVNINHPTWRILTDAAFKIAPAVDEDDEEQWSIDLPDQDFEWYNHEAYASFPPEGYLYKSIEGLADLPKGSLYTRHGCFAVVGPPELPQELKYERFANVSELAQKSIQAICAFILEHQYERFYLDIDWEYSILLLSVPQAATDGTFHEIIRKGLKSKLVTNFRGQQYIPRCDLVMFQQDHVIENIISQDTSLDDEERDDVLYLALTIATRLLLMCVYMEQPLNLFKHLVEDHKINDERLESIVGHGYALPNNEICQHKDCLRAIKAVYNCAPEFLPLNVGLDPRFHVWKKDMVIPLHFHENKRPVLISDDDSSDLNAEAHEIGRGANGSVLKVLAEPSLDSLSGVSCPALIPDPADSNRALNRPLP